MLVVTFVVSLAYEVWRATSRAGTSRHDEPKALVQQFVLYVAATAVIAALFVGATWATWLGYSFCVVMILVSILYYNPVVMLDRKPGIVDWIEDLLFTGLLFVAATLLLYDVLGWEMQR